MSVSRSCATSLALLLAVGMNASAQRGDRTDNFRRGTLPPAWTFLAPGGGFYELRDGWVHITSPGVRDPVPRQDAAMSPMLLLRPPTDEAFSFESRLRSHTRTHWAMAGLVAISDDLESRMAMLYAPTMTGGRLILEWWVARGMEGAGNLVVGSTGDMWLRVESRSGSPFTNPKFYYRQSGDDEPWIDAMRAKGGIAFRLPRVMEPRFRSGEYSVGLVVSGGPLAVDDEEEVAFDYFHSPEMAPLAVRPAGTSTTLWADLKRAR